MLIDTLNEFSDAQAITATAASTNVIDLGAAGDAIGRELYLHVLVTADFDSGADDGTLTVALQTDTVEAFSSPTTLFTTAAVLEAAMVAGYWIARVRVPAGNEGFLRAYYTVAGSGDFTAGAVDAFLSPSVQDQSLVTG